MSLSLSSAIERLNKLAKDLFAAFLIGFINGWLIGILINMILIIWEKLFFEEQIKDMELSSFLLYVCAYGLMFAGIPGSVIYSAFHIPYLKKIPFWRMWVIAFPITLICTCAGFCLWKFEGGYIGSIFGLTLTTIYFKIKKHQTI